MHDLRAIYILIPVGYAFVFVALLIATIVAAFFRTRQYPADYLLAGTLMTVPGIVCGLLLCVPLIQLQASLWESGNPIGFLLLLPFVVALACVTGSFWLGMSFAARRRRRLRGRAS